MDSGGGFGPSTAGIIMVCRPRDHVGRLEYWQRVFSFKRIGKGWFALPQLSLLLYGVQGH